MALKRYARKFVKTYIYKDETTGEEDTITFMANGYLFPLFKSLAEVELTDALADYKKGLLGIVKQDSLEALFKLQATENADDKLKIAKENADALLGLLQVANSTATQGEAGFDLIELIMICTRLCALPESERAEAMGYGTELLPQEVYEDPTLAFELLSLAVAYDEDVKKNGKVGKAFTKAKAPKP